MTSRDTQQGGETPEQAYARGLRDGRDAASQAILDHADKHAPRDGNRTRLRMRQNLRIAANVAADPRTPAEIAELIGRAYASGELVTIHADSLETTAELERAYAEIAHLTQEIAALRDQVRIWEESA